MPRRRCLVTLSEAPSEVDYEEAVCRVGLATAILQEIAERLERRRKILQYLPVITQSGGGGTFTDNFDGSFQEWLTK